MVKLTVAEISSYTRASPYVSAEEGEEEGEAKIAIFFPGISLQNWQSKSLSISIAKKISENEGCKEAAWQSA